MPLRQRYLTCSDAAAYMTAITSHLVRTQRAGAGIDPTCSTLPFIIELRSVVERTNGRIGHCRHLDHYCKVTFTARRRFLILSQIARLLGRLGRSQSFTRSSQLPGQQVRSTIWGNGGPGFSP